MICGKISKLVVVDTDDEEATKLAKEKGWDRTPYRVKTRKGFHFYFFNDTHIQKGKLHDKIDLQAEASYVLAPPSVDKVFSPLPDCDPSDLPRYNGPLAGGSNVVPIHTHSCYEEIDRSLVKRRTNAWEEAEAFVDREGRKLQAGDTCHNRIVSWVGHLIASDLTGQEIYDQAMLWCNTFMEDPFPDTKIKGSCVTLDAKNK